MTPNITKQFAVAIFTLTQKYEICDGHQRSPVIHSLNLSFTRYPWIYKRLKGLL